MFPTSSPLQAPGPWLRHQACSYRLLFFPRCIRSTEAFVCSPVPPMDQNEALLLPFEALNLIWVSTGANMLFYGLVFANLDYSGNMHNEWRCIC